MAVITLPPPSDGDDQPWARVYPAGVPLSYPYPGVDASRLLDDAAQDFPETVAIEYRRYRLSYRKLADHADRFATALTALGVTAGTCVSLLLPKCPQLVIALFAVWRVGARAQLLTPESASRLSQRDSAAVVVLDRWYAGSVAPVRDELGDAPVVITSVGEYLRFPDNALVPVWRLARGRVPRIPRGHEVLGFADLVRRNLPAPGGPREGDKLVAVGWSDGDLSQQRLVVNSFQLRLWLPDVVAGDERVLLAVPLSSPLGALWIVTSVLAAATMILVDEGRAAVRYRAAVRARPTILPFDRPLARQLLRQARGRAGLSTVRIAITRDDLGDARRRAMEQLTDKGRVRRVWGTSGVLTHADPIYGRYVERTAGLPLPDTAALVTDPGDARRAALPGARGTLWVRGPQLPGDRWIDARAVASIDIDGYLTVYDT